MVTNDCGPCLFAGISEFLTHSFLGVPHPNSTRCPQMYRPSTDRKIFERTGKKKPICELSNLNFKITIHDDRSAQRTWHIIKNIIKK